jgi:hypothetical protein
MLLLVNRPGQLVTDAAQAGELLVCDYLNRVE